MAVGSSYSVFSNRVHESNTGDLIADRDACACYVHSDSPSNINAYPDGNAHRSANTNRVCDCTRGNRIRQRSDIDVPSF